MTGTMCQMLSPGRGQVTHFQMEDWEALDVDGVV